MVPDQLFTIFMLNRALAAPVQILSTSSSKVVRIRKFFTTLMLNQPLATVSCTLCRPHLRKVRTAQLFTIFCDQLRDDDVVDK